MLFENSTIKLILILVLQISFSYAANTTTKTTTAPPKKPPETATKPPENNEHPRKTPIPLNMKQNLIMNQVLSIYALHNGVLNPTCKSHTEQFKEDLRAFQPWALKMFDASSKIQSAVLAGNLMEFGGYDQCLAIDENTPVGQIRGQHCVVEVRPSNFITEIVLGYRNISMERLEDLTGGTGAVVKWSICIPASCTASEVQEHFVRAFDSITEGADVNITVRNESCASADTKRPFTRGDYAVIILFGAITAMTFFSTLYDLHCRSTNHEPDELMIAFSAYTNTLNILKPPRSNQMNAIFGFRFLTMSWIVGGHRYFMNMFFPVDNTLDILDWMIQMHAMIVLGGTYSVDTFFFISGLLVAYVFLKHMSEGAHFNIALFWIHRILRLTPSYGITVLLYATIINHLGSGPVWNDLIKDISRPCYDHWWSSLLYIQNYINPSDMCIIQTWYLQCDTQLYIISPLVLLPLVKFPTFGLIQLVTMIVLSVVLCFDLAWKHQYKGGMPVTNALTQTEYWQYYYVTTHTRVSPWLLGILFGYIIFKTNNKKVHLNKSTVLFFWLGSITVFLACVFGAHPFQQPNRPYYRMEAAIYLATSRLAWALGIGWVLFACVRGYGGFVNSFLSASLFQIWGRLSYNIYLLHMFVQFIIGGNERIQTHFSDGITIQFFCADLIFTTILAYIFALYFESPIMIIERKLLGGGGKKKKIEPKNEKLNKV